jgi:endonuclease/exonuclease/phosphatase family metal-dependent hydrolase
VIRRLFRLFRYILLLLILLWLSQYLFHFPDLKGDTELRVVSFNVHSMRDQLSRSSFSQIVSGLEEVSADIILFQEFPQDMSLGDDFEDYHHSYFPYGNNRSNGMAIYSKYPFANPRQVKLNPVSSGRSIGLVSVDVNGRLLDVGVVHFPNSDMRNMGFENSTMPEIFGENLRTIQAEHMLYVLRDEVENPLVLAGDFNTFPFSACWRLIRADYADAFPLWDLFKGSYKFEQDLRIKIDHIFISDEVKAEDAVVLEIAGSDHLPVFTKIIF